MRYFPQFVEYLIVACCAFIAIYLENNLPLDDDVEKLSIYLSPFLAALIFLVLNWLIKISKQTRFARIVFMAEKERFLGDWLLTYDGPKGYDDNTMILRISFSPMSREYYSEGSIFDNSGKRIAAVTGKSIRFIKTGVKLSCFYEVNHPGRPGTHRGFLEAHIYESTESFVGFWPWSVPALTHGMGYLVEDGMPPFRRGFQIYRKDIKLMKQLYDSQPPTPNEERMSETVKRYHEKYGKYRVPKLDEKEYRRIFDFINRKLEETESDGNF